jgi:1,4-dihydroxy-6-naphthoate synthase
VRIRCSISPDADDLFMFRALLLGLIDSEGFEFDIGTADTDALNRAAAGETLAADDLPHVSAVSIAWVPSLHADWQLRPHGGSVGRNYGPVVIAPQPMNLSDLRGKRVAVPGTSTTAFTVLSLMVSGFEPVVVPITPPERVFEALAEGRVDAALLIHEGRLTFADHGYVQVADIGEWWMEETGLPLPLGGNVVRRDLGPDTIERLSRVLRASIAHALQHREDAIDWLLARGSGPLTSRSAVDHYLSLYANDDTLDYGEDGRRAVSLLLERGAAAGLLPAISVVDFAP